MLNATRISSEPYAFVDQVDAVIVGSCSAGNGAGRFARTTMPYHPDQPQREFFEARLSEVPEAKTVILITECCRAYCEDFRIELMAMYPHIDWIFPSVSDYNESATAGNLFRDLEDCGIIEPVKS